MSDFALVPRVLGVDYGKARVGIAVSDELGMLAHPVETVPAGNAIKRIAEVAREKKVERVVLGMPRQLDGTSGLAAADVNAFAEKLRAALPCELVLWDERLTSAAANRALRDAGRKTKQTRGVVDQVAAQMILQSYLDRCRTG